MSSRCIVASCSGPRMRWPGRRTTSHVIWQTDLAAHQRFFPLPGPALDLPLQFQGPAAVAGGGLKLQFQRPFASEAPGRLAAAGLMLGKAPVYIRGNAGIERARGGAHQIQMPAISHCATPAPAPSLSVAAATSP